MAGSFISRSTRSASTACSTASHDIGLTLEKAAAIDSFEKKLADRPWL